MKVGIIGCGAIAKKRHAPEYSRHPDVEEIFFYDRNIERARALAQEFEGIAVSQVEDLLSREDIVAISDCSSNDSHPIFTRKALKAGKHVLCEKPMALTVEDAQMMVDTAQAMDRMLMVGHNQRLTSAHQKVGDIIDKHKLGKVLTFKTNFGHEGPENWGVTKSKATWFFKKDRSGSGVAGDLGLHKIDLIHYLLKEKIVEVSGFAAIRDKKDETGLPIEVCDNLVGLLKTESGIIGNCAFSWTYYGEEDNRTIIYCEKGIVKIYAHPDFQIEIIQDNGQRVSYQLEAMQTNANQTNSGIIDAFINSIRLKNYYLAQGEDGLSALKVTLALIESSESGQHIKIK